MSLEIEIKAWVDDFEGILKQLRSKYTFVQEYQKDDRYYRGTDNSTGESRGIRIRKQGDEFIVTYKERSHQDKVEVNLEKEVSIDSRENFEYILNALGYKPEIEKVKVGYHFEESGINLELSHVKGLGNFIEIEIVEEDNTEVEAAKEKIFNILDDLGISRDKIEDRYYTQMLKEKAP